MGNREVTQRNRGGKRGELRRRTEEEQRRNSRSRRKQSVNEGSQKEPAGEQRGNSKGTEG